MALSQAGDLLQQVQELQRQMGEIQARRIQETLRANVNAEQPAPRSNPPKTVTNPRARIPGTSWAEEMDVLDPINNGEDDPEEDPDNDATSQADAPGQLSVVEVSQRTEEHLLRSFVSMKNADRRRLADSFSLPKVAVTRTPSLDAVMS